MVEGSFITGKFHLLAVAIDKYKCYKPDDPLLSPVQDANELCRILLAQYGFKQDNIKLIRDEDALRTRIISEIYALTKRAAKEDSVLIYFAGHGHKEKDLCSWIPHDGSTDSPSNRITNSEIINLLGLFECKHVLLVSDSCFPGDLFNIVRGADQEAKLAHEVRQLFQKTSCEAITSGSVEPVYDTSLRGNSIFAGPLLEILEKNKAQYLLPRDIHAQISRRVGAEAKRRGGLQTPRWGRLYGTKDDEGSFVFLLNGEPPPEWVDFEGTTESSQQPAEKPKDQVSTIRGREILEQALERVRQKDRDIQSRCKAFNEDVAYYREVASLPGAEQEAELAWTDIVQKWGIDPGELVARDVNALRNRVKVEPWIEPLVEMRFVWIPSGTFQMGSRPSDPDARPDEGPPHDVRITRGFWLGMTPVTQSQYESLLDNPSEFKGRNRPVEKLNWTEAAKFCGELSKRTRRQYRLPTEAEWEHACRALSNERYSFGDDAALTAKSGWCCENSDAQTHDVGEKPPNPWGLCDMHGNVWEWCSDWYGRNYYKVSPEADPQGPDGGSARVIRGGGFQCKPDGCRSARRGQGNPSERYPHVGFRILREE